jgi:hypothetical protein
MNEVTKLFSDLTDDQVREAVNQIREDEPTGIIRMDGYVRDLSTKCGEITGQSAFTHLTMVHMSIFREAAYRFSNR